MKLCNQFPGPSQSLKLSEHTKRCALFWSNLPIYIELHNRVQQASGLFRTRNSWLETLSAPQSEPFWPHHNPSVLSRKALPSQPKTGWHGGNRLSQDLFLVLWSTTFTVKIKPQSYFIEGFVEELRTSDFFYMLWISLEIFQLSLSFQFQVAKVGQAVDLLVLLQPISASINHYANLFN